MSIQPLERHSITMPPDTSAGVRERVGARGFSAYVVGATARQLQRDALADIIVRTEVAHGPVDEAEVTEIMKRLA